MRMRFMMMMKTINVKSANTSVDCRDRFIKLLQSKSGPYTNPTQRQFLQDNKVYFGGKDV